MTHKRLRKWRAAGRATSSIRPATKKALALAAGKAYCLGCGARMGVVTVRPRGKHYYCYRCQNNAAGIHAASCTGSAGMRAVDEQIWAKVWKALGQLGEFEQALDARITFWWATRHRSSSSSPPNTARTSGPAWLG